MSLVIVPPKLLSSSLLALILLFLIVNVVSFTNGIILDDHKSLVFHHCSTQKLEDPNGEYMDARAALFDKLQIQSSQSKFSRTFVLVGDNFEGSLTGLFQCRQDLDDHKCYDCMKAFRNISNGVCGDAMAARIQLSGCHVQYESDRYKDIFSLDEVELNHKCGEKQAAISNEYFEQMMSQAFEALETEIGGYEDSNGFYSINHEGIHAMAQCEVGVDECTCAKCVVDAIEVIEECVGSSHGQVFLDLCYLSYEFNPHEIHGGGGGGGGFHAGQPGARFGKVAAIAIGGVALLFVAFLLLKCLKKKDDD